MSSAVMIITVDSFFYWFYSLMINDYKRWKWKSDNMLRHKQRQNQEEVW